MKLKISGRNIEVSDAMRSQVEKKLGKLVKYFRDNDPVEATVSMQVERDRHIIEVTLIASGMILRAEEGSKDMYASIDLVVDKLERQIHKYKTRVNRKAREAGDLPIFDYDPDVDMEEDEYPKIVRTKRFAMKPMGVEEAILQMDLLGHDFFVFRNAHSEDVNVVYKRKDGHYGLIEPEF